MDGPSHIIIKNYANIGYNRVCKGVNDVKLNN
jgi:hypothetical protein